MGSESVIVVVDANRSRGRTAALEWALSHVVRPGDTVVFLGILSDSLPINKPPPLSSLNSCFPNMSIGLSIWEGLEFSAQGEVEPEVLEDKIKKLREEYHCHLQPFYWQCHKYNVKLEMKLAAGFSPKKITIKEAHKTNARWIVLDSYLKKGRDFIHEEIGCNIAVFKGSNVATILPSVAGGETAKLVKSLIDFDASTSALNPADDKSINGNATEHEESCWCPLSWMPGFPRRITHAELECITNNFSDENVICEEDGLRVYRGLLQETPVLVKDLSSNKEIYQSELEILSRARHRNILNLVGFCSTGASMYLLCDCPCNGSLDVHLQRDHLARKLSWNSRWKIALEICSCLRYLHEECQDGPIVHLALCSSHVVISHSYSPMLTNFTWAKRLAYAKVYDGSSSLETPMKENISQDVYAYGLFLLELLTGKPLGLDSSAERKLIVEKTMPLLENGSVSEMMDSRLEDPVKNKEVHFMALAASMCLRNSSEQLTIMSSVEAVIRGDRLETQKDCVFQCHT